MGVSSEGEHLRLKPYHFSPRARALIFRLALPLPLLGAIVLSCREAVSAMLGVVTFDSEPFIGYDWEQPLNALAGRRVVQRHFMDHGVYIPLENIIATGDDSANGPRIVDLAMSACGKGDLVVWVPLRFRFPLVGDWVEEWCWVPRIKKKK